MKKFIRFIARVSGVEKEIQEETTKQIGNYMSQYSHWFASIPTAANVLELYSKPLKDGQTTLIASQHDQIRDMVYELDKIKKNIHKIK